MTTSDQLVAQKARERLSTLQFYEDSLTNIERAYLAAQYLRKVPAKYPSNLLRKLTIAELAFRQVFSKETY